MKNTGYLKAKVLTLIPVAAFALAGICLILAAILEVPTSRGVLYTVFAFAGLMSIFVYPLPCLVMSAIGTVFAAKAVKDGTAKARIFLILGILEILVCAARAVLAIVMFTAGQGV